MNKYKELQDGSSLLNHITQRLTTEYNLRVESIFKDSVLQNAVPKIKGEITKGKIKWRGIKRCVNQNGDTWLVQRGVVISPIICMPKPIYNDNNNHKRKEV